MTDNTYWHKQTTATPLFPELEWSRPQHAQQAGKLAIIGGNLHGFAAPAEAFMTAKQTGIGTARVLLPLAVKKLTGQMFETLEFSASNPSGSFSQMALDGWMDVAQWADATLIAGDLGRNSETAIVFEKFIQKYNGNLIITKDAVHVALSMTTTILNRPRTTLVLSMSQLQKLGVAAGMTTPITLATTLPNLVTSLHNLTDMYSVHIVVKFHDIMCVAVDGKVSTTTLQKPLEIWRVRTAATCAVWWLQNPAKPFQALTTACLNP